MGLVKRRNNEKREEVLSTEYLCNKESKSIKIELSPAKRMNWYNLKPEQKLILQAARNNNVDYIQQMAKIHFANDFNFHDQFGRTPLYIAVINKNIECIRELIKIGADVNAKCENGNTCLHRMMLCKDGDPKTEQIIQMLLTNGQITKKELQTHKDYTY